MNMRGKAKMWREWDVQAAGNWWISLGFHIDHTDPSLTIHLPGVIIAFGRCKQPGFKYSLHRWLIDLQLRMAGYNPDEIGRQISDHVDGLLEDIRASMRPQIAGPFVRCGEWCFDIRCNRCGSLVTRLAIYEDDLPIDISDEQYNQWFKYSFVDGVRMGPSIELLDLTN